MTLKFTLRRDAAGQMLWVDCDVVIAVADEDEAREEGARTIGLMQAFLDGMAEVAE